MSSGNRTLQEYSVGEDWEDFSECLNYFVANNMNSNDDAARWCKALARIEKTART